MRFLPPLVAFGALGASLLAQANCSAGAAPPTTIWTMNPFTGTSLYGHPNYPNNPGPTYPGFSFLIDMVQPVDVAISRIDLDLYDDGNLVQVNSTTTVTSPNQVGATSTVTFYLFPGPTWVGNETIQSAWGVLGTGTLTVAAHHTDSQIVFNPPIQVPAGSWGICFAVPPPTNGPNPGPLHPMVNPTTTIPPAPSDGVVTLNNIRFQRESWTASLTPAAHTQSLEIHYTALSGYSNWRSFGAGCGGLVPPQLSLSARPRIGATFDFVTGGIVPTAALNFLLLGFTPDPAGQSLAPFGLPGCALHLGLGGTLVSSTGLVTNGASNVPLALPNDPLLAGTVLYGQSAPLLGGTGPAFQFSNAVCVAIGLF